MDNLKNVYLQIFELLNIASEKYDDATLIMLLDVFYDLAYETGCVKEIKKPILESDEDIIKSFHNTCISVTNDRNNYISVDDLYEQFILWMKKNSYKNKISKTKLRYCLQDINPAIKYNCRYKRLTHIVIS